jgi:hypothetical protein
MRTFSALLLRSAHRAAECILFLVGLTFLVASTLATWRTSMHLGDLSTRGLEGTVIQFVLAVQNLLFVLVKTALPFWFAIAWDQHITFAMMAVVVWLASLYVCWDTVVTAAVLHLPVADLANHIIALLGVAWLVAEIVAGLLPALGWRIMAAGAEARARSGAADRPPAGSSTALPYFRDLMDLLAHVIASDPVPEDFPGIVVDTNGIIRTTQAALGRIVRQDKSTVHRRLHDLHAQGCIILTTTKQCTLIDVVRSGGTGGECGNVKEPAIQPGCNTDNALGIAQPSRAICPNERVLPPPVDWRPVADLSSYPGAVTHAATLQKRHLNRLATQTTHRLTQFYADIFQIAGVKIKTNLPDPSYGVG